MSSKDTIKSAEHKEIQSVAAFVAVDTLYAGGSDVSKKKLMQSVADIFHGKSTAGIASFAKMAFQGDGPFARLYETMDTSSPDAVQGHTKVIPALLTRDPLLVVIPGVSFSLKQLQQATLLNKRLITGATLYNRVSNKVLKNNKKAGVYVKEFLQNGELPSGKTTEDLYNYVLDKMYAQLKGSADDAIAIDAGEDASANSDNENEAVQESDTTSCSRPPTWYYPGFWCLVLFGPMAPENERSPLLDLDSLDALKKGRKQTRKEEKKEKAKASNHAINGGSADKRGLGLKEKTALAHIAQQSRMAESRDDELEYESLCKAIELTQSKLQTALNIVKHLGIMDESHARFQKVLALEEEIETMEEELKSFRAAKKQKRETNNGKILIVDDLLKSVAATYSIGSNGASAASTRSPTASSGANEPPSASSGENNLSADSSGSDDDVENGNVILGV